MIDFLFSALLVAATAALSLITWLLYGAAKYGNEIEKERADLARIAVIWAECQNNPGGMYGEIIVKNNGPLDFEDIIVKLILSDGKSCPPILFEKSPDNWDVETYIKKLDRGQLERLKVRKGTRVDDSVTLKFTCIDPQHKFGKSHGNVWTSITPCDLTPLSKRRLSTKPRRT
ncbi:hypothetical protein AB0C21_26080 [Spirillospora sp. NPDC049024]